MKQDISVVITTLNEQQSITPLLDSLATQELSPKEIIIVDAGSTDLTMQRMEHWHDSHKEVPLMLIKKPGLNRSQGRNYAIEQASSEIIAVTDSGCIADKKWLLELRKGFDKEVEVVAGFYLSVWDNPLQHCFALYTSVHPSRLDTTTFLPSSRSIAFTKNAWEGVGRYPEELETCEDLVFASRLKQQFPLLVNDKSFVYWRQKKRIRQYFSQIAGYTTGDMQAAYMPHMLKIITVFYRYVLFIWVPWIIPVYLIYPMIKFRKDITSIDHYFMLPVVQFVTDIAVMWGAIRGLPRLLFGSV